MKGIWEQMMEPAKAMTKEEQEAEFRKLMNAPPVKDRPYVILVGRETMKMLQEMGLVPKKKLIVEAH